MSHTYLGTGEEVWMLTKGLTRQVSGDLARPATLLTGIVS